MSITSVRTAAVSVAEYSARIVRSLRMVGGALVEGEVQKPKSHPSGMLFFDLTDGTARLPCKVFRNDVAGLEYHPRHGDLVQVRIDRPNFWVEGGRLDVVVSGIRLAGEGELLRRREELLARLRAEGLCETDRWPRLPRFPRAVGVIAAHGSDGLRDVVAALQDRFPPVHIVTCTATVQGAKAPLEIIDALAQLDAHPRVDVIVIARGGGSVQDLVAFDDERLCRAISASFTPVVAAIGHTDNVPVANHVAWSSETPSRSPELAVPSAMGLRNELELAAAKMAPLPGKLRSLYERVAAVRIDAASVLDSHRLAIAQTTARFAESEHRFFAEREAALARAREVLAALPGRLPERADIEALGSRLDARAVGFFATHTEGVREAADDLRGVGVALAQRAQAVTAAAPAATAVAAALESRAGKTHEEGSRLGAGIRKELADHLRDYDRGISRRVEDIARIAAHHVVAEQGRVAETLTRLCDGSRARLREAERGLEHVAALLTASDPRIRGWVLPTRPDGAVVRSVKQLRLRDPLILSFHDGAAGAVVNTVPDQEVP
jgi:exodeoxyribonuclease VII large subunit